MGNTQEINKFIAQAGELLWGPWTVGLVLLVGLYITLRGRFFQLTGFGKCLDATLGSINRRTDGVSPLQTACAALAGTLGTGNIIGVAAAISIGGAGSLLWMCAAALLGMATACAENVLGMLYRRRDENGSWLGGAMQYMERGLGSRTLAVIYAALTALAAFCVGGVIQVNSIASSAHDSFGIPPVVSGIVVLAAAAPSVLGGVKTVGRLAEKLVPLMAGLYILACIAVLTVNARHIPGAVVRIFSQALDPRAAGGGFVGAVLTGVRRGVFTNEAGLGTSVAVHACAEGSDEMTQGRWAMFEVFFDTIVICTLTGLVLLTASPDEISLTEAFSCVLGKYSGAFLTVTLLLFAFATVVAWSCYGERAFCWLFGQRGVGIYRVLFLAVLIPGALLRTDTAWAAADCVNALLALSNSAAVLMLSDRALAVIAPERSPCQER